MNYLKYFLFSLILLWLLGFFYVFRSGNYGSDINHNSVNRNFKEGDDTDSFIYHSRSRIEFKRLEEELQRLEVKNQKNELIIKTLKERAEILSAKEKEINNKDSLNEGSKFPSKRFEELRRKIYTDIKDVGFFINAKLDHFDKLNLAHLKKEFNVRINLILGELYNLSTTDSLGEWRQREAIQLTNKVQKDFERLQNPKNCDDQRKIICDLNKACGFGCQVHHVMFCFITSYFNNRTMILESGNWRYNSRGFEAYFKPLSETCKSSKDIIVDWSDEQPLQAKAVRMPIIDVINKRPKYFPLSIPNEYQNELKKFHGDPFIWWAGNILNYLMRFNDDFLKTIENKTLSLGFKNTCIGVHVRRTDKVGTEAAFHGLDEYMKNVENFFELSDSIKGTKTKRLVYLATDEIQVLKDAREKYPNYQFIFDEENARSASVNQRYSPESAQGVISDIYFLSQCEYLVCTFSSQVCRLAYELMQVRFPDASWRFRSLDDVYYFGGQNGHEVEALYDHIPDRNSDEIALKKGDLIGLAGNHWNGRSKGKNYRTNEEGLFPSFKVKDVIQVY